MSAGASANVLTIGSRGSQLALWQARYVASRLEALGVRSRIETIKTTGDHLQTASLVQAGGKGLFTKEIEEALLAGTIDVAVHSLKDLPAGMMPGLAIAAIPEREDPRDAIVGCRLSELRTGAKVGTSSGRRAAQLRYLRPDLQIEPIRGNVDTRLRKLRERQYDAIVLAAAGLRRLGLAEEIAEIFSAEQMCPAAGQGALAVETRQAGEARSVCERLDNRESRCAAECERAALAALGGGCQLPIGVHAETSGETLRVMALVISPDGKRVLRAQTSGFIDSPEDAGRRVAEELLERGAGTILAENR